jgi:hypothetical protein
MADIGVNGKYLVSPNAEIEALWKEAAIQEKRSKIVRAKQDIEDLMQGKIKTLQADIKMWELEIKKLENIEDTITT